MTNPAEWIDGFLFVGNQRALDFLNTRLIDNDGPVELLPDVAALGRWLVAAEILSESKISAAMRVWQRARLGEAFLQDVLEFRESLRAAVVRVEAGRPPGREFLAELNQKLLAFPTRYVLTSKEDTVQRKTLLNPENPDDLWSPVAEAAAALFTDIPPSRLRKCPGCVVNFYDISKKGSRRWCSMNLCGNRDKIATYRNKHRHKQRISR